MPMQFRKQRLALALALTLGVVGSPVLAQSATETAERDQDLVLNLRDADINGLIEIVSQETGINFIVDPRVRGQVNVVSGQPIRREELYDLFLGVLKSQGFAAVRGSDGRRGAAGRPTLRAGCCCQRGGGGSAGALAADWRPRPARGAELQLGHCGGPNPTPEC